MEGYQGFRKGEERHERISGIATGYGEARTGQAYRRLQERTRGNGRSSNVVKLAGAIAGKHC